MKKQKGISSKEKQVFKFWKTTLVFFVLGAIILFFDYIGGYLFINKVTNIVPYRILILLILNIVFVGILFRYIARFPLLVGFELGYLTSVVGILFGFSLHIGSIILVLIIFVVNAFFLNWLYIWLNKWKYLGIIITILLGMFYARIDNFFWF